MAPRDAASQEERQRSVAKFDELQGSLRTLAREERLDEYLTAIASQCGSCISYEYPTIGDLGISIETITSDENHRVISAQITHGRVWSSCCAKTTFHRDRIVHLCSQECASIHVEQN